MSKRFLDTSIWERPWFMDLGVADKMAVMYLFAKCDAVGVWVPNYKLANFQLGAEVDWESLIEKCNGNVRVLDNGKWWVVDFCKFQYGELVDTNNAHRSYLSLLRKHGLEDEFQGLTRGCQAPMDKDKDKEKDKELEKDKDKEEDKELYHAVEAAFLSRNGDRFTNFGKEGKAIHGLVEKAKARMPDDPGAMLHAILDAFWKLKTGDTSAKGFWRGQPFLPSALSPLWDRVLETMREDVVSPELLAIVNGGKT
jgi:hypothetical protein